MSHQIYFVRNSTCSVNSSKWTLPRIVAPSILQAELERFPAQIRAIWALRAANMTLKSTAVILTRSAHVLENILGARPGMTASTARVWPHLPTCVHSKVVLQPTAVWTRIAAIKQDWSAQICIFNVLWKTLQKAKFLTIGMSSFARRRFA